MMLTLKHITMTKTGLAPMQARSKIMCKETQKIAVITDVHGNLPALEVVLREIKRMGCDAIFHTGDAISIGPFPAECLELLLSTPNLKMTMGNHDQWFAFGLPTPQPSWMSDGEVLHQQWVHSRLDPALREVAAQFPYRLEETFCGLKTVFMHYKLIENTKEFAPALRNPASKDLDTLFCEYGCDILFYGHEHSSSDITGNARYINPGSLGCNTGATARAVILEIAGNQYDIRHIEVPYDDTLLFYELEKRRVPDRDFIRKIFYRR